MDPASLTITPTAERTDVLGVPLRVWTGTDPDGVRYTVYVALARTAADYDPAALDRHLQEVLPWGDPERN